MGLVCVTFAKVATRLLTQHTLSWLCALLGIPCVCVKRVSRVTSSMVHYSSGFNVLTEVSKAEVWLANYTCTVHGFYSVSCNRVHMHTS